jgi:hypothetical protein
LCNPYVLARPRTTSTDAPRNPSKLAPSQQKDQKIKQIQKTEKKSLVDPGRHFPVPYYPNTRPALFFLIRRVGQCRRAPEAPQSGSAGGRKTRSGTLRKNVEEVITKGGKATSEREALGVQIL